jgi:hypothetical protein
MAPIEVGAVWPGKPVVAGAQIVGYIEEAITQPDGLHVQRLVIRSASPDQRLVAIPANWISHVDDQCRVVLRVTASELAHLPEYAPRSVRGVGSVGNLSATGADAKPPTATPVSAVGYGAAWLRAFLTRASGPRFEDSQAAQLAALAERKLVDLFDVAAETAIANGRARILRHDLPITKGLRALLGEVEMLARDLEVQPLLVFLADAGVPGPLDETVKADVPRLMAALLLLLGGRLSAFLEPENVSPLERLERLLRPVPGSPTRWEVERAASVLSMTL